jgi:hypothetical protein
MEQVNHEQGHSVAEFMEGLVSKIAITELSQDSMFQNKPDVPVF